MTKFEFLMMIASVVIAVGMTEIVGGWGRMARTTAKVSVDWLHLGWTIYILLVSIQYWIGMWSYNRIQIEYVGQIYFLVIPTLFIVLAAFVVTPDVPLDGELEVREYYWSRRAGVFLPMAAFWMAAWIADLVIVGVAQVEIGFMTISLASAASLTVLVFTKRMWIHAVVLSLSIAFVLGYFFAPVAVQDERWIGLLDT